ncbi:hypothetical protein [Pseudomonas phage LKA1]|uniref:Uncharacterized protein n=1 Tax=Pseudomonas phage LKA1 TaxID=386793 RepID=Q0E608_9CAUD|nr:hypothetical protein AV952_gp06 [Pseudomonas phage LKA1]CAK24974.1 hypothetical protein [Pseudomonas phage LKA1]
MSVDVQEVFNKVIDAGLYWAGEDCEQFMCHALWRALTLHIISHDERTAAGEAIREYVHSIDPLAHALVGALGRKLRHALTTPAMREGNLTELYRDWANRPMP